jgi:hypothetical protein
VLDSRALPVSGSGGSQIKLEDEDDDPKPVQSSNIVMQNMQVKKAKPMKIKLG